MACYHPLKGFKIGYNASGKPNYKITSYDTTYVVKNRLGQWIACKEPIPSDSINPIIRDSIDIPCGKCVGCLLGRSRDWADRCMLEANYHDHNAFITLTYNDEHLPPKREIINSLTGEISESPYRSLRKKDFQDFMKRLRYRLDQDDIKIRFFACGEYGDFEKNTGRPHYHAIIFGYDFPDKEYLKSNFRGEKYYTSQLLQDAWSIDDKPIGHTLVTDISWDTCAYVARYCLKKRDNDLSEFYKSFALDPEFTIMSRKPGIARQYYDEHKDSIYDQERIILSDEKGGKIIRPPKYFDRLYDIDNPEEFESIKANRSEFVNNKKLLELSKTDLDYLDYLKVKEYNFHKRTAIFNERSKFNEKIE